MADVDPTAMQFDSIQKSYGARKVLRGFSGTLEAGRVTALVGPNGAGKTTLLRIAAGLQRADSGTVKSQGTLYYGGFDTLPTRGTINQLRIALGRPPIADGTRRMSKLSRGELHKVGLDLAFELAPAVLLLDEPWTALEPDAREALNERISAAARSRVIVCSSHDLDEVARVAHDVVFLADGIGSWKRGGDAAGVFERDELIRLYRESKRG